VHATLAGVAFGLLAPARPLASAHVARRWAYDLSDEPTAGELREMTTIAKDTVSIAERVQHVLHPMVSFVVVPVFALANAGVRLSGSALTEPVAASVAIGVSLGLTAGKLIGITGASVLAVRLRIARPPDDVAWPHIAGAAAVAGIGFTVSLFITGLAFASADLQNAARLAVLAASIAASLAGSAILYRASKS
jgi:NhaA family Na+:H+ antiporter